MFHIDNRNKTYQFFLIIIIFAIAISLSFKFVSLKRVRSITINGYELTEKLKINKTNLKDMSGKDITVAIIDTGLDISNFQNKSRIKYFKDFVNSKVAAYDDNGHGSKVATIIGGTDETKGIANDSKFIILKAFDNEGKSNIEILNSALNWVLENLESYNISIVNLSLGIEELNSSQHIMLKNIIGELHSKGLIIVSAVGNGESSKQVLAPASYEGVICVGSIKESNDGTIEKASYSRGKIDSAIKDIVYTYGSNITIYKNNKNIDSIVSGTSYSAAIVSGVITLLKQKYIYLSNKEIEKKLIDEYCTDINGDKFLSIH